MHLSPTSWPNGKWYTKANPSKNLCKIPGTCSVSSRCAVVVNILDQIRPKSGVKPDCACVLLWVCLNVHFCARDRWQQRTFKKKKKRLVKGAAGDSSVGDRESGWKKEEKDVIRREQKAIPLWEHGQSKIQTDGKCWDLSLRSQYSKWLNFTSALLEKIPQMIEYIANITFCFSTNLVNFHKGYPVTLY